MQSLNSIPEFEADPHEKIIKQPDHVREEETHSQSMRNNQFTKKSMGGRGYIMTYTTHLLTENQRIILFFLYSFVH